VPGAGDATGGGEALVHRATRRSTSSALPRRREARGAAGGALEAAPAAADERAGVEVASATGAAGRRADAADHVVEKLGGSGRGDLPWREQGEWMRGRRRARVFWSKNFKKHNEGVCSGRL